MRRSTRMTIGQVSAACRWMRNLQRSRLRDPHGHPNRDTRGPGSRAAGGGCGRRGKRWRALVREYLGDGGVRGFCASGGGWRIYLRAPTPTSSNGRFRRPPTRGFAKPHSKAGGHFTVSRSRALDRPVTAASTSMAMSCAPSLPVEDRHDRAPMRHDWYFEKMGMTSLSELVPFTAERQC